MRYQKAFVNDQPGYLQPYARAAARHGGDFRSLLWASRRTQELRFDALTRLHNLEDQTVLDLGCGRADLMDFLIARDVNVKKYIGVEGVPELANVAESKKLPRTSIVQIDFVREPKRLDVGADVIVCSGALNTLERDAFHNTIKAAFDAARVAFVFNFLSSSLLAGVSYLHWYSRPQVTRFGKTLTDDLNVLEDYIEGDCSMVLRKNGAK